MCSCRSDFKTCVLELFSLLSNSVKINPLALELDIYSLAHHLCKM